MRWLLLEEKFLLNARIEECSPMVMKALNQLGLKRVAIKREVPPHYLMAECDFGWGHGKRKIEFVFKESQNGSEVSLKWPYAVDMGITNEKTRKRMETIWEGRKQKIKSIIEEFKSRVGAIDMPATEQDKVQEKVREKEIIREKEVIVKIRCPYCHRLYDETLNSCPHCGGRM
jgi:hypothetical protein